MTLRALPNRFIAFLIALGALASTAPAEAFDLQAHRGGRGLRPENTLVSFENALRLGVTTLELDIAITADGVAVISHDPAEMRKLIDWGVDGIITDYPDRLREVMRERGMALPRGVNR
jgi:glycerophosphoryl diester phosphodiesterase